MTSAFYARLHLWLRKRRRGVLVVMLLLVATSLMINARIRLQEDILDTLPRNDQRVEDYKYALRKFRQIDRVYLDVGITNDDPEMLVRAADEVFATLSTNAAFDKIMYRFEPAGQGKVANFLTSALPNLFSDVDAVALEEKLSAAEVRNYLTAMRRRLAGPEGMILKDVVAADPIGSSALVLKKVLPLQTGFGDAQLVDGRVTSNDGRHVLILAEPRFPSSNSGESEAMVADLTRLARAVEREFPGVHVAITGGHRMSVDNASLIKSDAIRCIFIGMGAMLVLCLTTFRRRWLAIVAFIPSLVGTLLGGVVLALWQPDVSAIATGFAVIAVGITVDYAIHMIYHLDEAAGLSAAAVGKHIGRLVLPISVGALTSAAAFALLAGSPMHGYQQLGVFGLFGVLFSAAFALVILPLLVPVPKTGGQPVLWLTRGMVHFHQWQSRLRPVLLLGVLVLTIVAAFGARKLRFDGDLARLNGITESTRHDEALIRKIWGDALGLTLIVTRGATTDQALAQTDHVAARLAADTNVAAVYSLASACPSAATQEANIARWQNFWTPERRTDLREILNKLGAELGFRADAFDAFWRRVETKPAVLTLEVFRDTPLEQALIERVAVGTNETAVSTLVRLEDRMQVEQLREALPGVMVLDRKDFVEHIGKLAKSDLRRFAIWAAIIVSVIVYLSLGSVELLFAVMSPIAFGILWTLGLMGWLGLPIDMMNCVFVIFIIGISEDYSLFLATSQLDEWRGQPARLAATSASVLISALTTLFGFAVLAFAKHPVLFSMGTTVLIGMASAFAATVVLTPLCMRLLLFKDPPRGAPRWWHLLGTVWAGIQLFFWQVFVYGVMRPLLKLTAPKTADARARRTISFGARTLVQNMPFGKLEWQGITAGTFTPPCIVISNHQSAVDVLLMVAMPGDVRQTPKKRVFDTPILGVGCKVLGHVMVEPDDPDTTLARCREKLTEGACVHFYPEGTRSFDGFVQRFHRGAFKLAVELNQEILPIIFCDTNTAMPRDTYWFEPYHVTVRALPRITPRNFDYSRGSLALMRHCETVVREALQQQLDAVNTPAVARRKVNRLYRYQGKFVEQFVYWKLKGDPMFEGLDKVVPRAGKILDLGCGYGVATHWLACFTDQRTFRGVDYDEDKIRVARRTAPDHPRITFEVGDILEVDYPPCDAVLLLDVLHYWRREKQQAILEKARRALRPGGRLILRDGMRSESAAHERVAFWERIATRIGHNVTREGLHFQTLSELEGALRRAGFSNWETKREAGRDSNLMLVATV
jgi:1-acyl-sn-glycerol-3-phosphate acyltransferase